MLSVLDSQDVKVNGFIFLCQIKSTVGSIVEGSHLLSLENK